LSPTVTITFSNQQPTGHVSAHVHMTLRQQQLHYCQSAAVEQSTVLLTTVHQLRPH